MDIRLTPERCKALVASAGFETGDLVDLPPYHFGFVAMPDTSFLISLQTFGLIIAYTMCIGSRITK